MGTNFIITTTNNIEGGSIKKYIDTICSNVVVGTNIFSDFAASITDFFGGRSSSYQKKLETIYKEASEELKRKAYRLGANAIIGFKVDFDEISGKDKSMFMVSASGTACLVEYKEYQQESISKNDGVVEQSELDKEILRRFIVKSINNGAELEKEWVEFLCENPQEEIIDVILGLYREYHSLIPYIEKIISAYPKNMVIEPVYSKYIEWNGAYLRNLIINCNLFDAKSILMVLKENVAWGVPLLLSKKDYYTKDDVENMDCVLDFLDNLPNKGKIEVVKGMFGKEQEKYICPNGHKNEANEEYCGNQMCGLNIKGLTEKHMETIMQFKENVDALKKLISGI